MKTKLLLPLLLILCVPLGCINNKQMEAQVSEETSPSALHTTPLEQSISNEQTEKKFLRTKVEAEAGDPIAQYSLGMMYELGGVSHTPLTPLDLGSPNREVPKYEVPQDLKEAAKWYRKAALQGHAEAQYSLGNLYNRFHFSLSGKKLVFDDKETMKWYRKAAAQGHVDAQMGIARLYGGGHGVPVDYVTAYAWYSIAVANDKKMTAEDITKAEALAKEMVKKNPKLLKPKK